MKRSLLVVVFCLFANLFLFEISNANSLSKVKTVCGNILADTTKNTIVVKGVVQDADTHRRVPFSKISVTYRDTLVCYVSADKNGEYEVSIQKEFTLVDFMATNIGYDPHILKNISISKNKNIVVDIDIRLVEEKNQKLQVKTKASK
ncbi:MAG: hypothetical protein NTX97_04890 [Bacteroidetes bacterium]|nr:hypothetical protein [Bacteroidota bacterium]